MKVLAGKIHSGASIFEVNERRGGNGGRRLPHTYGFLGRFNGSYRREVLDATCSSNWMEGYNTRRPHEALGNLTPNEWPMRNRSGNMENSTPASVPAKKFTT